MISSRRSTPERDVMRGGKAVTFKEVLTQVIDWLQQDKRLSYRALKRQFALDDDYLDDLKAELIEVRRVAVDEDGRVLVWTGDAGTPPSSPPPSSQYVSPPATVSPPIPEAERRQLTVMFCDLVDSIPLSGQLDPEDLREVIRTYQTTCAEEIQRSEGHIAQYLGDGLLVYFGYPQAHEDEAQRAVRTGLGIVEAMAALNSRLGQTQGAQLAVRVGIHTGLVVVGAIGGGGRQEQLALGETPNIAARLQGLAAPNTVVMSEATARLVEGYFTCAPLGVQDLKGVAQSLRVSEVLKTSGAQTRLDVVTPRGFTPLIGRDEEVALVHRRWEQAKMGLGQVVLI